MTPENALRQERLLWLARLRWWAVVAVVVGAVVAKALSWQFVSIPAVIVGAAALALVNGVLWWRARRKGRFAAREILIHIAFDFVVLTWLLAWSGGIRNPMALAFSFHVVLGALLHGRRGAVFSTALSVLSLASLAVLERYDLLPSEALHRAPGPLWGLSVALLLVGVAYLALVVAEEQQKHTARVQKEQADAERLERLATLGRAMQGVAHELNTPLTTMQTLAKDLVEALARVPLDGAVRADVEESLALLIDESRRCKKLTQALLSSGKPSLSAADRRASYREVAERAVLVVHAAGDDADVELVGDGWDGAVPVDADRVLQVMMNLIQNALLATEAHAHDGNGARVRLSLHGNTDDDGAARTVAIHIEDRGPGLPAEVRAHLFEPFVTTRATGQGTGLGLYTSHMIARELGGDLRMEDRLVAGEGGGTRAVLILPAGASRLANAQDDGRERPS